MKERAHRSSRAFALLLSSTAPRPPRIEPDRVRVAAIGDSNTWGMGAMFSRGKNSYPAHLQKLLGSRFQVLNYGLNARTLLRSGDAPYDDNRFSTITTEIAPKVVLLMLGTNDSKSHNWNARRYESELTAFVGRYTSLLSDPRVFLLTPPVAFENRMKISPSVVRHEVAPIVRRVATSTGTTLIDVFEATEAQIARHPDGVHPDEAGYRLVAETVYEALVRSGVANPS